MKITKLIVQQLEVPLIHPYVLSKEYGIYSVATPVIVTIETDEGITGYGECDPWPLFTGDSSDSVVTILTKHIGPMILGADPTNINEIHRLMDAIIRSQNTAKSSIDMACYDILGKSLSVPVYRILGGELRNSMYCMWSAGGATPDEAAKAILQCKEEGYKGCMIKVGTSNYKDDVAKTKAVRNAVGDNFPLIADANQGWDIDTAIKYCKEVSDCNLLFFEQPLQSWDVKGMARIRRSINIPLSADEGVTNIHDAKNLVDADAVDIFSVKVSKNGGILPTKNICEFASANGIKVFFNSMIEEGITEAASLNIAVTCGNIVETIGHAFFSPLRLDGDICSYYTQIKPQKGITELSKRPGLGIDIHPSDIKKYLVNTIEIK